MTRPPEHIAAQTFHGRRDATANAFRYGIDYLLIDPTHDAPGPRLFARNRRGMTALFDSDHGGPPGRGRGLAWVREVIASHGLIRVATGDILLLAQPRLMGHVFNPVSFWLIHDGRGRLRAAIAEVSNTFGDRHCYLCRHADLRPIEPGDRLAAAKALHVSPFQPVAGGYRFGFDMRPDRISIRIDYRTGEGGGLYATLTGRRRPLTNRAILAACLRRPFGARRVLGLIHWQAFRLWWKGARYRGRPAPPRTEVSR